MRYGQSFQVVSTLGADNSRIPDDVEFEEGEVVEVIGYDEDTVEFKVSGEEDTYVTTLEHFLEVTEAI
jgi:hypothetical protein